MHLFYFKPVRPQDLKLWFILEAVFIVLNYILFLFFLYFGVKIRAHLHMKIMGIFLVLSYYPCLTARLVILGFQGEVFALKGDPKDNFWLVLCSWFRCFVFGMIATIKTYRIFYRIFFVAVEREFALYYIRDYEKTQRLWIPFHLIVISTISCLIGTLGFTYEWVPWPIIASCTVLVSSIGLLIYLHTLHRTQIILNRIYSRQVTTKYMYTLSLRFQLEENIWCGKLMKNALITLGLINVFTFFTFIMSRSEMVASYYGQHFCQLLDCLFNIFIAANSPTIGLAVLWQNDYLISMVKSTFFGTKLAEKTEADYGRVYFTQLQRQWDVPLENKEQQAMKKKKKRRFSIFGRLSA